MNTANEKKLERIEKSFIGISFQTGKDGYPYSMFSLTDFSPAIRPELVEDMAEILIEKSEFIKDADILVSEADRGGGPLTHAVARRVGLPYTLANWYPKESPGEIVIEASVGFSGEGVICLNGVEEGMKVVLVDDLLSSGGTAAALLKGVIQAKATPLEALFVGEKVGREGREALKTFDIPITSLVRFKADGDMTTKEVE